MPPTAVPNPVMVSGIGSVRDRIGHGWLPGPRWGGFPTSPSASRPYCRVVRLAPARSGSPAPTHPPTTRITRSPTMIDAVLQPVVIGVLVVLEVAVWQVRV